MSFMYFDLHHGGREASSSESLLPSDESFDPQRGSSSSSSPSSSSASLSRVELNKLVLDYLVTEGFKEASEKLSVECGVKADASSGLASMENRILIRDAVQSGRIAEAVHRVQQLYPELLDDDKTLFFHLQQQQLIELIRDERVEEALRFAAAHLAETESPKLLDELERTMALLAFDDPNASPFADLLSHAHRQKVASELNSALLRAQHHERTMPKLDTVLRLLMWAQKELEEKHVPYEKTVDLASIVTSHKSNNSFSNA